MENRDRDKISKSTGSSSSSGQKKSDSSTEFGQKIDRSENIEREPSRRSGSDSSGMHSDSQGESGVRYRGGNRGGNTEEL